MTYLLITLGALILAFIIFKIKRSQTIENMANDLSNKENVLSVQIYKEARDYFTKRDLINDPQSIAVHICAITLNKDLTTLKNPINKDADLKFTYDFLDNNSDVKDMVITFLRAASVIHLGLTSELFIKLDSPTHKLMMKYGSSVPRLEGYNTFWGLYNNFMRDRWKK